jgi:hypothetical protein
MHDAHPQIQMESPMTILRRFVIALATASALAGPVSAKQVCYFGECGPATAAPAAPASTKTQSNASETKLVGTFGTWKVMLMSGQRVVVKTFDDGAAFVMAKVNGEFVLMFVNPEWNLTKGQTFPLQATIDGKTFNASVEAADKTLLVAKVSAKFIKAIYLGDTAKITAVDNWTLDLSDADRALDAAGGFQTVSQ